ncbi:MAG TPA: hypothetical protein VFI24_02150 [Pyrinomonadaceae bacterium]|nr:hypothetical protein [Pyrinomonadaceae bacterium]
MNPDIEREEMRSYLLGTVDGDRRTQVEERILFEPSVYEELLVVEEELIDQYVAGDLSASEKQQFETHFLITAERQKNLRFGKLLRKYAEAHPEPTRRTFAIPVELPQLQTSFLGTPQRKSAFVLVWAAFLGIIITIVGVTGGFNIRREATNVSQQIPRVVITLTPEGVASQRVNVPPKGSEVKLELELANPKFRNYKSELFRENQSLQVSDALRIEAKGDQSVIPFTITSEMLSPGDYQVKLSGVLESGADEFIDNYSFRVVE